MTKTLVMTAITVNHTTGDRQYYNWATSSYQYVSAYYSSRDRNYVKSL